MLLFHDDRYFLEVDSTQQMTLTDRVTGLTLPLQDKESIKTYRNRVKSQTFRPRSYIRVAAALGNNWLKMYKDVDAVLSALSVGL